MTIEEYQKKIDEQKDILNAQINQVNKEFIGCILKELEEHVITSGAKVSVKNHGVVIKLTPKLTSLGYLYFLVI